MYQNLHIQKCISILQKKKEQTNYRMRGHKNRTKIHALASLKLSKSHQKLSKYY